MSNKITKLNLIQLEQAVRRAAFPADRQIGCFTAGLDVPYEIADDIDNWCGWVLGSRDVLLSNEQRSSLSSLNAQLDEMSGEQHSDLWTEDALRRSPEWDNVRREARKILNLFGWAIDE